MLAVLMCLWTLFYQYVGSGPVVHGAKGLSIAQVIDVDSLRQHFLTDIALARTCFDSGKLREGVIRLRSECVEAFKKFSNTILYRKVCAILRELA